MVESKVVLECEICGEKYHHGPHVYEGHKLTLYGGIFCCNKCWDNNSGGWDFRYESSLLKHLKLKDFSVPKRNSQGLLPRD